MSKYESQNQKHRPKQEKNLRFWLGLEKTGLFKDWQISDLIMQLTEKIFYCFKEARVRSPYLEICTFIGTKKAKETVQKRQSSFNEVTVFVL